MSCTRNDDVVSHGKQRVRGRGRSQGPGRTQYPGRSPKKEFSFITNITKAVDSFINAARSKTPPRQRPSKEENCTSPLSAPVYHSGPIHQSGTTQSIKLPRYVKQEENRNQPASSSHGDLNGSRETDVYQIRAPPPGSYQDDDTGPSPKNLVMAVMGVKSAVNHFAKALILDMNKYPKKLGDLKQRICLEVQGDVDRPNHWKFLVQAFVCKRLFEGFETENGFFGIKYFDSLKMTPYNSFADFSKFKDKAATISGLLAQNSADLSFLGMYCFKKFMSISGDLATNQPLPLYEEEWRWVERGRHPQSEFYQSFLKVAVSVWLLHRLVFSFEQGWSMLGWETFPKGCKFQRKNMESVVPGGFEEEDEETGTDVSTVVGFLVIPGFQVSKSVVKCEVYLRNKNNLHEGKMGEASEMPSRVKSFEKSYSDKTPANYLTPEKDLSDRKPGSLQTPESFTNYSGHSSRGDLDVEASGQYWSGPITRDALESVSGRSRNVQGKSPKTKSGHLEAKDRGQATTWSLPTPTAPPGSSNKYRPPDFVTRHTKLSKQREESSKSKRSGYTQ